MLFDQKEFEQKIGEASLKKGLKLFAQNKIVLLNKIHLTDFNFLVTDKIPVEIFIKKNNGKILEYKCSCNHKKYCEHLAAILFYLQDELLDFSKKQKANQKKGNKTNFKNHETEFGNYLQQFKQIIKPFLEINKLSEKNVEEIHEKINFEKNKASVFSYEFYLNLALVLQITQLVNFNAGTPGSLVLLINDSIKELEKKFNKGLNLHEKKAWLSASENSLRSQAYFRTGSFYFLISKALIFFKDKKEVEKLLTLIKKRIENKNNSAPYSKKLVIEIILTN